jgi:hypothetical protein
MNGSQRMRRSAGMAEGGNPEKFPITVTLLKFVSGMNTASLFGNAEAPVTIPGDVLRKLDRVRNTKTPKHQNQMYAYYLHKFN